MTCGPIRCDRRRTRRRNKFETGTQNHEGIAGILGAIEYFEWLGGQSGESGDWRESGFRGRKLTLKKALTAIRAYEFEMSRGLIEAIESVPGTRIYGISDARRLEERVPNRLVHHGRHHAPPACRTPG